MVILIRYNITVSAFTDEVSIEKAELSKVGTLAGHAIKVDKTTISGRGIQRTFY